VFSGSKPTDQWLGSRAISVEKANTANAFDLDKYAISTANLWAQSQPGGYLYGAASSNPPVAQDLYAGDPSTYGSGADPLTGKVVGGVIAFGGGLGLYSDSGVVGGIGASGNTSCADHNIAWRMRKTLGLDKVKDGPSPAHNDAIVYDIGADGKSLSGWGHPQCGRNAPQVAQQIGAGVVNTQADGQKSLPSPATGKP
jgi:heme-degrading protein